MKPLNYSSYQELDRHHRRQMAAVRGAAHDMLNALKLGLLLIERIEQNDTLDEHEQAFADAARAAIAATQQ